MAHLWGPNILRIFSKTVVYRYEKKNYVGPGILVAKQQ